ncbi:MAG: COX15/CtaA family protein [Proteobacteria bacterium]|nr:COX15/CtaA family protein [Pseudomonadota bacterium]
MRRLAIAGVILCFTVVVLGGYVRLTAAGLGCPDWPGCYGKLTPSAAAQDPAAQAAYNRPLEVGKAWHEMIHRYVVGALSLIILAIATLALRYRRQSGVSVQYALTLLGVLVLQALLGMLTVTWRLNPLIVTAHLLLGLTTLSLLWWLTLSLPANSWGASAMRGPAHSRSGGGAGPYATARTLTLAALVALIVQLALGGWTSSNYAAIACPDFPTCQGALLPHADFRHAFIPWHGRIDYEGGILAPEARTAIHFTHRLWALMATVLLLVGALYVLRQKALSAPRPRAALVLGALGLQLAIGISMVVMGFPLWLATAHTAGAALLLMATLALLRSL